MSTTKIDPFRITRTPGCRGEVPTPYEVATVVARAITVDGFDAPDQVWLDLQDLMAARSFGDVVGVRTARDLAWDVFVELIAADGGAVRAALPLLADVEGWLAEARGRMLVRGRQHHSRLQPRDRAGHFVSKAEMEGLHPGLSRVSREVLQVWFPLLPVTVGCCSGPLRGVRWLALWGANAPARPTATSYHQSR